MTVWRLRPAPGEVAERLAHELGISRRTARVLAARGWEDPEDVRRLLAADPRPPADPFLLPDMEAAVARLRRACAVGERVLVHGDYDVDGLTATALLVTALRQAGAQAEVYIPHRLEEGYGLSVRGLAEAARNGVRLVVTVDCGTTAVEAAQRARELGLDLIVTDHHEPGPQLPACLAVVNPRRADSLYPFPALAGVGVAYQLARALFDPRPAAAWPSTEVLDLVALGTVADVVPLLGENRDLVRAGLTVLRAGRRCGLRALAEVAGCDLTRLTPGQIAFALAPRLNALGRLEAARAGVDLLLTEDEERARELAAYMDALSRQRQRLEAAMLAEAQAELGLDDGAELPPGAEPAALVAWREGWHRGVVGIVAARLVERWHRPAFVAAVEGEEAHGSARSVPGFPLPEALAACQDLLTAYGGHALAAGFRLPARHLPLLRARLADRARAALGERLGEQLLLADSPLALAEATPELAAELAQLGPFGAGHPAPVFLVRRARVARVRPLGEGGDHWQLVLRQGNAEVAAVRFRWPAGREVRAGDEVDLLAGLEAESWQGQERIRLLVRDMAGPYPAGEDGELELEDLLALAEACPEAAFRGAALRVEDARGGEDPVGDLLTWAAGWGRERAGGQMATCGRTATCGRMAIGVFAWRPDPPLQARLEAAGCQIRWGPLPPAGEAVERVIVWEPVPLAGPFLRWLQAAREVVLLWPRPDARTPALLGLDRGALARVYRSWVRVRLVRPRGALERAAARIFRELGLVEPGPGEFVVVRPGPRRQLEASPTFRRLRRLQEEAHRVEALVRGGAAGWERQLGERARRA